VIFRRRRGAKTKPGDAESETQTRHSVPALLTRRRQMNHPANDPATLSYAAPGVLVSPPGRRTAIACYAMFLVGLALPTADFLIRSPYRGDWIGRYLTCGWFVAIGLTGFATLLGMFALFQRRRGVIVPLLLNGALFVCLVVYIVRAISEFRFAPGG